MHPLYRLPIALLLQSVPSDLAMVLVDPALFPPKLMVQRLSDSGLLSRAQVLGPVVSRHRVTERL